MEQNSVIGIDLGATNVRVGKVKNGKILKLESQKIKRDSDPKVLLRQIIELSRAVLDDEVAGIGIGVPGIVDVDKGIVYDVLNIPSWQEVALKPILEEELDTPVAVNNDANCFALGEKYFGKGKNYKSCVGLIIGTGFAAGLILNGHIYDGKHCGAGELGMILYKDSIYEHYCSAQFFEREFSTTGLKVFQGAQKGDMQAIDMYKKYGYHLGNGLKLVMHAYDPEIIILGGSVRHAYSFFQEAMWENLKTFSYSRNLESVEIQVSDQDNIAVLGAAALALEALVVK